MDRYKITNIIYYNDIICMIGTGLDLWGTNTILNFENNINVIFLTLIFYNNI